MKLIPLQGGLSIPIKRQLKNKDEDRVIENNEGLPQPFLGTCNDRARQLQASSSGLSPCLKIVSFKVLYMEG
ncbi:unnamed protein product [Brassica napus]|uniref:(rape) hypothetical protein n=1 Tax=Brassica napus TaxID=3708 RepID=A0A816QG45_BRANA|nr:unnamed protein product [Brassica napus]